MPLHINEVAEGVLLQVLETYPRDELFQVGTDELLPVAMAVLYLQERRPTRRIDASWLLAGRSGRFGHASRHA